MRTSNPCSTVSYNTSAFLYEKLSDLVKRRIIDFFLWVEHFPEEDESKKHKHVFLIPNKMLDTDSVREYLLEQDPNNDKPLGCLPFRKSRFQDWFLYGLHEPGYLAEKGQRRKYVYQLEDFTTSDPDYFAELRHEINWAKVNQTAQIVEAYAEGVPEIDILRRVPLNQVGYVRQLLAVVWTLPSKELVRKEKTHTPSAPSDDGFPEPVGGLGNPSSSR